MLFPGKVPGRGLPCVLPPLQDAQHDEDGNPVDLDSDPPLQLSGVAGPRHHED